MGWKVYEMKDTGAGVVETPYSKGVCCCYPFAFELCGIYLAEDNMIEIVDILLRGGSIDRNTLLSSGKGGRLLPADIPIKVLHGQG